MRIGFGKVDITPRIGVELLGFGPFRNRRSVGVRDRLWAKAMAVEVGGRALAVVSCDLGFVLLPTTKRVRALVKEAVGLGEDAVMVHCTHTHSGPATGGTLGWGEVDLPYMELLPRRIADACIQAVQSLAPAELSHAEVPCEGIGLNREQDGGAQPLEVVLRDDWRPPRPELTDTRCHVFRVDSGGKPIGFLSYFGCHPVVCCEDTRYIHGDFVGVATNMLERENPGTVGLFLQGAQGDINSCVVHKPERESLLALDVIAARYANAVRPGLRQATPVEVDSVACIRQDARFPTLPIPLDELRGWLAEQEAILGRPGASDEDRDVRMATVRAVTLRKLIARLEAGESPEDPTELQGFRIGPVALLGSPFEVMQAIKNDVVARSRHALPLVMGLANDGLGYAPDRDSEARAGYAARTVPMIKGTFPFRDIHGELVKALLRLDEALAEPQ
ncbi:MAG: neutral/alkaline non-lysosomal ceramidase N-terminal domain-containing protein [Armatimonadetes bacterium]|nr:neutral/alkaline non-lysosomal ceramidase N-terminal domain-containing protein [Armatimonadota bacterium]